MLFHDSPDHGEPEPRSSCVSCRKEGDENLRRDVRRDARAVVGHLDDNVVSAIETTVQADDRRRGRLLRLPCITQQVDQYGLQ